VIITSVVEPKFLTVANFDNIVRQFGTLIFAALGMTFVIMAGFLDLSIGGIISLVAVVTVTLIDKVGQGPAILIGISVGLGCGLLNSVLILTSGALTQAESLFITFGMSLVYGAVALMYVQGVTQFLTYSTSDISIFETINAGQVGFLSVAAIMFLASLAVLVVIERRTYMGRAVVLTGGNKVAARLAGIPISKTIVMIYAISGVLSAIGAVVLISRVTLADPTMGTPYMTQAILAVVVGGTALVGGRGSVLWTVLGTFLLIMLNNCLNLLGVSSYVQFMLWGVILIAVIWLDAVKQARVNS
jgi:ribose transport system permease protein